MPANVMLLVPVFGGGDSLAVNPGECQFIGNRKSASEPPTLQVLRLNWLAVPQCETFQQRVPLERRLCLFNGVHSGTLSRLDACSLAYRSALAYASSRSGRGTGTLMYQGHACFNRQPVAPQSPQPCAVSKPPTGSVASWWVGVIGPSPSAAYVQRLWRSNAPRSRCRWRDGRGLWPRGALCRCP